MPKKTNILITGANGFIGSHLMEQFSSNEKYRVIGLVRKTSKLFRFEGKKYEIRYGSIDNNLKNILKDIDIVVHAAGKASDWGRYDEFYKTNVLGTINLIQESIKANVKRFIHFSSTVVYGFNGNINTTEDKPFAPFNNNYCKTKAIAEMELSKYKDKIEIIIIRPSNVFGPDDISFTLPLLKTLEKGLFGFINGGRALTSPCYVKNLSNAVELAVTTETGIGEAFNISDGNDIPWIEFLKITADNLNAKTPKLFVPSFPLMMIARLISSIYNLFGSKKPPFLTPYRIAISSKNYSFSIEKAKKLLNYNPPYTTERGIKESIEWYNKAKKNKLK